jgi:hypothetical protein
MPLYLPVPVTHTSVLSPLGRISHSRMALSPEVSSHLHKPLPIGLPSMIPALVPLQKVEHCLVEERGVVVVVYLYIRRFLGGC